ncbi:MAG: argininosuccinate lyase [Sedimentisphaerales bacterium]|nr:argininosuccinate lyase [Sedimentisphaerales bacterium]
MAKKSWQSRMSGAVDELAVNFVESISVDWRLYKYDIVGSIAHAQMLSEQGLISKDEFRQIKQGLTEIAEQIEAGKFKFDKSQEDIHMVIEAALTKNIGEAARKLHTGRSRNDQVALDMRLWLRDCTETIIERIMKLQEALVKLAQKQGQVVMPGYTHLQRAQPVLSGHYLLAFAEQLQRDRQRFSDALKRINVCPLGSGALAGSSLPLNRRRVMELLGFAEITRNSIDGISDRDFCAEFVFTAALTAIHLSRLAEDWIIYSTQEFGFIRIGDAYCTGSSMMPQKRNPDMLELIRGKSGQLHGNLTALLTMLKGQPLAYNRDMQEDKKQVFDAADTLEATLAMAAAIVANTRFNPDKIQAGLDEGFLDATALAEYLVRKGVPFRQAHQIVGELVAQCEAEGKSLAQKPLDELQKACDKIEADVYENLTAENVVAGYAVEGSAGKQQLQEQLDFWQEHLKRTVEK